MIRFAKIFALSAMLMAFGSSKVLAQAVAGTTTNYFVQVTSVSLCTEATCTTSAVQLGTGSAFLDLGGDAAQLVQQFALGRGQYSSWNLHPHSDRHVFDDQSYRLGCW